MGKLLAYFLLLVTMVSSCDYYTVNAHRQSVGYIEPGTGLGDPEFKVCFEEAMFPSYYARTGGDFSFGKDSLRQYYQAHYDNAGITNESGYITLRFIINCKGETGDFQIIETGIDYSEKQFHKAIVDKLLELTTELDSWEPMRRNDTAFDCYKHLTFKIENGELVEILP